MKIGIGGGLGPFRAGISTKGIGGRLGPVSVGGSWRKRRRPRRQNRVTVTTRRVRYLADSQQVPPGSTVAMTDLTGASAAVLAPTGPGDLVAQLNAASRIAWWPWLLVGTVLAVSLTVGAWPLCVLIGVLGLGLTAYVAYKDQPRRRVVVTYEVEGPILEWFQGLVTGWPRLASLGGAWRIQTKGSVTNTHHRKMSAMASHLVTRTQASFRLPAPRVLDTNIDVPSLSSGGSTLYLLPDRVLVKSGRTWSDVDYRHLNAMASSTRFIEDGRPPRDSQQVGTTWRYANVKGGPDRRFKDNRQLPIMLYGQIELSSTHGLAWVLDLSQPPMAEWLATMLRARPATLQDHC